MHNLVWFKHSTMYFIHHTIWFVQSQYEWCLIKKTHPQSCWPLCQTQTSFPNQFWSNSNVVFLFLDWLMFVEFIILVWNNFQYCCNHPCQAFFIDVKSLSVAELEYGCGQVNVNLIVDLLPSFMWLRASYCTWQIWQPNLFLTFFFFLNRNEWHYLFFNRNMWYFGGVCRLAGPIHLVWSKGQAGFRFKGEKKREKM